MRKKSFFKNAKERRGEKLKYTQERKNNTKERKFELYERKTNKKRIEEK